MTTTNSMVEITTMRRRHLRNVLRIEEQTSSTPWSLGLFLAEVRRDERDYIVALSDHDERVVGFAGLLYVVGEGHVTTVAVDPAAQGARIGTRLLLELARRAIARGSGSITLEVRASNKAALALYRRFGFAPSGARKDYYKDPTEDALVLWAHDIDSPEYAERLAFIEEQLPGAPIEQKEPA
jgi:ribosomal-protein-alanine N-acetyltransferase